MKRRRSKKEFVYDYDSEDERPGFGLLIGVIGLYLGEIFMAMNDRIKFWMWRIGLKKAEKCPICQDKLMPHYDYEYDGSFLYTCDNKKCKFNNM